MLFFLVALGYDLGSHACKSHTLSLEQFQHTRILNILMCEQRFMMKEVNDIIKLIINSLIFNFLNVNIPQLGILPLNTHTSCPISLLPVSSSTTIFNQLGIDIYANNCYLPNTCCF
jgi:hypothetical protein